MMLLLRNRSRISLVSAACAPEHLAYWWLHGSVLGVCGAPEPALAEGALKMAFLASHDPLPSQQSGLSGNCRALLASSLKSKVIAVNITPKHSRTHTQWERETTHVESGLCGVRCSWERKEALWLNIAEHPTFNFSRAVLRQPAN